MLDSSNSNSQRPQVSCLGMQTTNTTKTLFLQGKHCVCSEFNKIDTSTSQQVIKVVCRGEKKVPKYFTSQLQMHQRNNQV